MEDKLNCSVKTENISAALKVPFNQLCLLFEKIHKAKNNQIRKKELQKFITQWRDLPQKIVELKSVEQKSFYPVLRLMLPQLDRERGAYGVKEVLLAKLYIEVLDLAPTGADAKRLLEYRNPKTNLNSAGDFAEIAYQHILLKRCKSKGNLTIKEINSFLDKLALYNNEKKRALVKKTLMELVQNTSAMEQKWLIRILLKETKLKMGHKLIFREFHEAAEDLFNATTSLKQVSEKLVNKDSVLMDTEIELFQPFRPMLALNIKIEDVETLMNHQKFSIEIKYDGERSQLHKDGKKYKYFSRSGKEYSTVFGDSPYSGSLTPFVHDCFRKDVKSCILDGEMMGFDPNLGIYMQKGGPFDIKHVTEDSDLQPCLVVFDILYLNGLKLASTPQYERIKMIKDILTCVEGRIQIAEEKTASSNQEVLSSLNTAIDRREEGIIVKNPTSNYCPNKRNGSGWFKIKPEYVNGLVDDFDLVIVGGTFGTGRHGNQISTFHCAVGSTNKTDNTKAPEVFKTFCRVASGFTNKQLLEITEKLKPNLKVFEKKNIPNWLRVTKEKPDVYVHPQDSIVVQIRATEILPSTSYAAGCTLRFPRLIQMRDDKTYLDALDTEQLENLRKIADGKLATRHATIEEKKKSPIKKRKATFPAQAEISSKYLGLDTNEIEAISDSFHEKMFCVITGNLSHSKLELEKRIIENGGTTSQNPSHDIFCVIAKDEKNIRVRNAIQSDKYDVVKVEWLVKCLENSTIIDFQPNDIIHSKPSTKERINQFYDKFGDRYDQDLTIETLQNLFKEIPEDTEELNIDDSKDIKQIFINQTSLKYHSKGLNNLPSSLFQNFYFYILSDFTEHLQLLIKFYSGIICSNLQDPNLTHVVITQTSKNNDDIKTIQDTNKSRKKKFYIVADSWVIDCVKSGKLCNEVTYNIKL